MSETLNINGVRYVPEERLLDAEDKVLFVNCVFREGVQPSDIRGEYERLRGENKRLRAEHAEELEAAITRLTAENEDYARAMMLAWGGVCPSNWAYTAGEPMEIAERIRSRGDELQSDNTRLTAERDELRRENAELRAVVERLPPFHTKDGVEVKNGDVLYWLPYGRVNETKPVKYKVEVKGWNPDCWGGCGDAGWMNLRVENCYSTREAAERAAEDRWWEAAEAAREESE
ncbi:MAG: hypothetical protein ABL309_13935 [Phycisphaerales bacterium]